MKTRNILLSSAILLSAFIISCSDEPAVVKNDNPDTGNDQAKTRGITINLTDGPGDFDEVNIYLKKIQVLRVDSNDSKWVDLNTNEGYYDLLVLQNGIDTTIVKDSLSIGTMISQIRMILADSNNVLVDSNYHSLFVPSGTQTGFKINLQDTVSADSLNITIDFDAEKSIKKRGDKDYLLTPVLKLK